MTKNARLILGIILLIVGAILPLGTVAVARTGWPTAAKTAAGGVLFFGFEILSIPAVALMGKENFERIVSRIKDWLGLLKPAGDVGPTRHAVGLLLFLLPIVPTYIMAYVPQWLPDNSPERLYVNLGADAMFLASFFVLGGDFWDKIRAIFVRNARVVFPEPERETS